MATNDDTKSYTGDRAPLHLARTSAGILIDRLAALPQPASVEVRDEELLDGRSGLGRAENDE